MVLACTETSRADVGSSRMTSDGVCCQRPGDCHDLLLAAAEHVWVFVHVFGRHVDEIQQVDNLLEPVLLWPVDAQRHLQDLLDILARVQR